MNQTNAHIAADNDEYWTYLSAHFPTSNKFSNLENAYCGMLAHPVFNALQRYQTEINSETSYFLRTKLKDKLHEVKHMLAEFCGVDTSELLITRNLTEAIYIILRAYPFHAGDEILYANMDCDSVQRAVEELVSSKRLKTNKISITDSSLNDAEIVKQYERAITANTRVIMLTHLSHRNGQILPVADIAEMAKRRGLDVILDAAHSFAHLDYRLPDLGCDFIGVNLYKWLGAPLGTGLLYIRRKRLLEIIPTTQHSDSGSPDIDTLASAGFYSPAPILAITDAIRFQRSIGTRNIELRLRHLSQYWWQQVRHLDEIKLHTPADPQRHCAILAISVSGMSAQDVVDYLMHAHQIFTVTRFIDGVQVVRITPHIFTCKSELDRLAKALIILVQAETVLVPLPQHH